MNYLKLKDLEYPIEIKSGEILNIKFLNLKLFLNFYNSLINQDSEYFSFSENYTKKIDLFKKSIFIENILSLNLNDKKIINSLYKQIEKYSYKYELKIFEINKMIQELLAEIKMDIDGEAENDMDLSLGKLLGMYNFKFIEEKEDFKINLISYLRNLKNISNFSIVFVLDGLKFLDIDDYLSLEKELEKLEYTLINFSFISISDITKNIKNITVDDVGCIF